MVKETSANKLLRDNLIGQTERYEIASRAAQSFQREMEQVGSAIEQPLKDRITEVHNIDKVIVQQRANLDKQTKGLQKSATQLQQISGQALSKVKETGDVQNWAEIIDEELRILELTARAKAQSSR